MNNEFIPYEEAIALKELGFDGTCYGAYNSKKQWERATSDYWDKGSLYIINEATTSDLEVLAPLYQQAFRWFREKHKIYPIFSSPVEGIVKCHIPNVGGDNYSTYEEAELACLKKLIEIVKEYKK